MPRGGGWRASSCRRRRLPRSSPSSPSRSAPSGWLGATTLWFGVSATAALLLCFLAIGREFALPPWYALTFPLAALVYFYIAVRAVARGDRVEWKGRAYQIEPPAER